MIYNDAYSVFAGDRHPVLLGSKVLEGWPEVADFNANVLRVGLCLHSPVGRRSIPSPSTSTGLSRAWRT
jgi:hypothetical protein